MKKIIIIILLTFFTITFVYSQDLALLKKDTSHIQKKEKVRTPSDSTKAHQISKNNDKFIDKDGDGINDNRIGRGMGLGKSLGKHKSNPVNTPNNNQSNVKKKVTSKKTLNDKAKSRASKHK